MGTPKKKSWTFTPEFKHQIIWLYKNGNARALSSKNRVWQSWHYYVFYNFFISKFNSCFSFLQNHCFYI